MSALKPLSSISRTSSLILGTVSIYGRSSIDAIFCRSFVVRGLRSMFKQIISDGWTPIQRSSGTAKCLTKQAAFWKNMQKQVIGDGRKMETLDPKRQVSMMSIPQGSASTKMKAGMRSWVHRKRTRSLVFISGTPLPYNNHMIFRPKLNFKSI